MSIHKQNRQISRKMDLASNFFPRYLVAHPILLDFILFHKPYCILVIRAHYLYNIFALGLCGGVDLKWIWYLFVFGAVLT